MAEQTEIVLAGLPEFRKEMKSAAPDYLKEMNANIRVIGKSLAAGAQQLIPDQPPMSGWNTQPPAAGRTRGGAGWPVWNTATARKSITFVTGGQPGRRKAKGNYVAAYSLKETDAAATIFDWAGKGEGKGTGVQFLANIRQADPRRFRVLVKYLGTGGAKQQAQAAIAAAIKAAEAKLQARV